MEFIRSYSKTIEEEVFKMNLPHQPSNLYDPLRYFLSLGGKRMRPILTLLGTELFGAKSEDAMNAALAVEVFHNFSLIHDDIMDEAPLRRNKETIHTKWNSNIAILSGDVLLVKAYEILANQEKGDLRKLIKLFNKTAIEVCEGQQMDMDFESLSEVSIEEYTEMIRLKTSVLLGCALEMGAIVAGATDENCKLIYEYGLNIGLAFQIQDDVLDLYADPEKFGKQVGGDVISNKKTMLYLEALKNANHEQLERAKELYMMTDLVKKVEGTRQLFNEIGAREICEQMMDHYYSKATTAMDKIDVDQKFKQPLTDLSAYLLVREH